LARRDQNKQLSKALKGVLDNIKRAQRFSELKPNKNNEYVSRETKTSFATGVTIFLTVQGAKSF
jgi:hypothetical protein